MNPIYCELVFDKRPWAIIILYSPNYGPFQIWDLSIPSERAPSKLSLKLGHENSSYRANSRIQLAIACMA